MQRNSPLCSASKRSHEIVAPSKPRSAGQSPAWTTVVHPEATAITRQESAGTV